MAGKGNRDFELVVGLNPSLSLKEMQSDISSLITDLNAKNFKIKVGVIVNTADLKQQVEAALSDTVATPKNGGGGGGGSQSKEAQKLTKDMQAYGSALSQVSKLLTELRTKQSGWTAAVNTPQGDALNNYIAQLEILKTRLEQGELTSKEFSTQFALIRGEAASTAEEMQRLGIAQAAASPTTIAVDTQEYAKNLKTLNDLLSRVTDHQNKWTAAQHGTSSQSYAQLETYANDITTLISRLQTGTLTQEEFNRELSRIRQNVDVAETAIKGAGEATKSWSDRIGGLMQKFSEWFSLTRIIMAVYRAIRQMVSASIELDDAMTQLKIVTKDTDDVYARFGDNIANTAKKIGSSITDLLSSTTTYARLGYSLNESSALAEYTAMLQNVGDIDVSAAQDAITAIIKAFGVDVNDIESIMDKLVVTGNNFPISVAQIAEGMNNASSALAAAGNTFEQSVALLTAANTTIQNAAKSSTGLRTIAARIRNTKTELDDLGEEMSEASYGELVQQLTDFNVALTTANGEYRSTYDIMYDIAQQWSKMTSMEQAALATAMSGTRQQAVFYSIIEQFQEAEGAMRSMADSTGELQASYDTYLESTTAHINQFKAAFQELASDTFTADFLNEFIDLGTTLIGVLETVMKIVDTVGGLNTVLNITIALIAMLNAEKILGSLGKLIAPLTSIIKLLEIFNTSGRALTVTGTGLSRTFTLTSSAASGLAVSISTAQIAMAGILAVIGAVSLAIKLHQEYVQGLKDAYEQASATAEKSRSNVENLTALKVEIDNNTRSLSELYQAFRDQLTAMGYTERGIQKLVDKYHGLKEAIEAVTEEQLKKARADTYDAMLKAGKVVESEGNSSRFVDFEMPYDMSSELRGIINRYINENKNKLFNFDSAPGFLEISSLSDSIEDINKYYNAIKALHDLLLQYQSENGVDITGLTLTQQIEKDLETLEELISKYQNERQYLNQLDAQLLGSDSIKSAEDLDAYIKAVSELADKTEEDKEQMIQLGQETYNTFAQTAEGVAPVEGELDSLDSKIKELNDNLHDTSDMLSEMKKGKDILADATEEMKENGEISNDTVQAIAEMMDEGEDWLQYLKIENGQIKLNTELWKDRILSKLEDNIATLDEELVVMQQQNDELINQLSLLETRNKLMSGTVEKDPNDPFGIFANIGGSNIRNKSNLPDNIYPGMRNDEYGQKWREQKAKESEIADTQKRRDAYKAMYDSWASDIESVARGEEKLDEETRKTFDWISTILDRIQRKVNEFSRVVGSKFKSLSTRNEAAKKEIEAITEEIELQEKAYQKYIELCESINLSDEIKKTIENGAIDISDYDEETAELISQYQEWYEAALDTKEAVDELHESLASMYDDEFNRIQTDFENRISLLEYLSNIYNTGISQLETEGYMASAAFYESLTEATEHNIELLKEELDSLEGALQAALDSGEIEMYSEAWYGYITTMNGVKEAIADANLSLAEFAKTMQEIDWEYFDYLQERISNITDESEFLLDLLGEDGIFKDGKLTAEGLSVLGLRAMDYNVYMAQADKYAQEIAEIEQQLANDPNNRTLLDRREELLELQRQSILAAEDEKDAILDLVQTAIEEELDSIKELIEAYKDALDAAKDLYDYRNKIADETSDIASLQKQLSAYSGDDSEEARATIQQLKDQLIKAQKELEETEYDKYISDQKKLLDNLYAEYELLLNRRMDNTDALLADVIAMVNQNANIISDTLHMTADSVGYTLTDSMQTIWGTSFNSLQNVVTMYGEGFLSQLTTTNQAINNIANLVSNMQSFSNSWANNWIGGVNSSYTPDISGWTPGGNTGGGYDDWETEIVDDGDTGGGNTGYTPPTPTKQIQVGGLINAGSAPIYDYAGDTSGERQYYRNDPIYRVLSEKNGYLLTRWYKLSDGYTGWFKRSDVKAYKRGGLVDETGLMWLDGTKQNPEAVLNSEQTERFIGLSRAMEKLAKNGIDFSEQSGISAGVIGKLIGGRAEITPIGGSYGGYTQDVQITIPIDHVFDYNDFISQLVKDKDGRRIIQALALDAVAGKNNLSVNKFIK